MFIGFFPLEGTVAFLYQALNASLVPTAADSLPGYRVYGPDGTLMNNGTGTTASFDSANVTGVYRGTKAASSADGYEAGETYHIRVAATVGGSAKAQIFTFIVT